MFRTKPLFYITTLLTHLWALVLSYITKANTVYTAFASLPHSTSVYDLSPRPYIVITINPKSSENKVNALVNAGFSARSDGRYKYYMGPPTEAALKAAVKEGVVTDARAPGNTCSINGFISYLIISRVTWFAFVALSKINPNITEMPGQVPAPVNYVEDDSFKLTEKNLSELPERGFFFSYFDGLLLPDKGTTITEFVRLFTPLLGKTPAVSSETVKTLFSGWSSLQNTVMGKETSHMIFCIGLACSCGVKVRPVFLAGSYSGCVFYTDSSVVMVGGQAHVPETRKGLEEGIARLKSHEAALLEICTILNDITSDVVEGTVLSPENITSARLLHNAFRTRTLASDATSKLAPLLRKLRFEQTLWDVTNPKHVQQAVAIICKKEFPSAEVPMNLRIDAVFSKQPIYSVLGAFGNKAPSIRGSGSQIVRRIARDFYKSLDKPGRLVGIPIFAKAHNEAKEDWEAVMREYTVFFDTKGADKEGKLRVKMVSSMIPFDSDEGKAVSNSLVSLVAGKKRERDEDKDGDGGRTQEELDQEAKAKRRRQKGLGMLGLAFDLPAGTDNLMVEDDEEDFFATAQSIEPEVSGFDV